MSGKNVRSRIEHVPPRCSIHLVTGCGHWKTAASGNLRIVHSRSCPPTCTAIFSDPFPIFFGGYLHPIRKNVSDTFPIDQFLVIAIIAWWLPHLRSIPSVSFFVRIPFSYNSIAKIVYRRRSNPDLPGYNCHSPLRSNSMLLFPQFDPKAAIVSYSGRRLPAAYLYSLLPALQIPLHVSGQFQYPCLLSSTRVIMLS